MQCCNVHCTALLGTDKGIIQRKEGNGDEMFPDEEKLPRRWEIFGENISLGNYTNSKKNIEHLICGNISDGDGKHLPEE